MKVKWEKLLMVTVFTGMLCAGVIYTASAKFWGWQTMATTDWADGKCAYRKTCRVHYILWMAGDEVCETVRIACIE